MNDKPVYRASVAADLVAAAGVLPFFVISGPGAGGGPVVVHKVVLSGPTLTLVAYASILATKHSTAWTGGTPVALTKVPCDSELVVGGGSPTLCQGYTAGPTGGGALVGALRSRRVLAQSTTAAAAGIPAEVVFDFGRYEHYNGIYLRSAAESLALAFAAAPASAVSMALDVEWTQR